MSPKNNSARRPLNQEELKAIKDGLIERRKALWTEVLDDLENDAMEEHREMIETIREHGDMALEEIRESTAFSLIELKHNELEMIEQALERMEKGEYGRCVDCRKWITPARLRAMPYAIRCRDCQDSLEQRQRALAT